MSDERAVRELNDLLLGERVGTYPYVLHDRLALRGVHGFGELDAVEVATDMPSGSGQDLDAVQLEHDPRFSTR